jgi:hypothetical protein
MAFHSHFINDKGQAVFDHYGLSPSSKAQENPFRTERTSSFFVNQGKDGIYFKDFGEDSIKGNWYNLISLFEKTQEASEIIKKAKSIYGIEDEDKDTGRSTRPRKQYFKKTKKAPTEKKPSLLSIDFKPFTNQELAYWKDKGNISEATLIKYNVRSVEGYKTSDKQRYNLSHSFAYPTISKEAYKLYTPKSKLKARALPNFDTAKVINKDFIYSFGINHLKAGSAIICEGEADCLALNEAGFNAFTLGSVCANLKDYILVQLKAKGIKHISIVFDTDYAGITNAKKLNGSLSKHFTTSIIDLPKLPRQSTLNSPKIAKNDVCDYLGLYGLDNDLKAEICASRPLKIHTYLSEAEDELKLILQGQDKILSIQAGTGTGKTKLSLDLLPKLFDSVLFCVPTKLLAKQIAKEYNLETLYGDKKINDSYLAQPVKVCTYDKALAVYSAVKIDCVVIDEAHYLSSAYGYRLEAINSLATIIRQSSKTILLSATPCKHVQEALSTKNIIIKKTKVRRVNIKRITYKDFQKSVAHYLANFNYKKKRLLVKVDNKEMAENLEAMLIGLGILDATQIDCIFSELREMDETEASRSLEQSNCLPSEVRLVFATSIIDTGVNINDKDVQILYATTRKEATADFIQFVARLRKIDNLEVVYFEAQAPSEVQKPSTKKISDLLELAEMQVQKAKLFKADIPKSKYLSENKKLIFDYNALVTKINEDYIINSFYLSALALEDEVASLTRQEYFDKLSRISGFKVSAPKPYEATDHEATNKALAEAKAKLKVSKTVFFDKLAEAYQDDPNTVKQDLANNYEDKALAEYFEVKKIQEHVPSLAEDRIQAKLTLKFLKFVKVVERYQIKDIELQSRLATLHKSNPSKLLDTVRNYMLLEYDKTLLGEFQDRSFLACRNVLDKIKSIVEDHNHEATSEASPDLKQARRQLTIYKKELDKQIGNSTRKTKYNINEMKHLKALTSEVKALEDNLTEVNQFIRIVKLKLGVLGQDITHKTIFDTVNLLYNTTKVRRKESAGKVKAYIKIGKPRSFEDGMQKLGFTKIEADTFVLEARKNMAEEMLALNSVKSAEKRALRTKESSFLAPTNLTKTTLKRYSIDKEKVCNWSSLELDKPTAPCPF